MSPRAFNAVVAMLASLYRCSVADVLEMRAADALGGRHV